MRAQGAIFTAVVLLIGTLIGCAPEEDENTTSKAPSGKEPSSDGGSSDEGQTSGLRSDGVERDGENYVPLGIEGTWHTSTGTEYRISEGTFTRIGAAGSRRDSRDQGLTEAGETRYVIDAAIPDHRPLGLAAIASPLSEGSSSMDGGPWHRLEYSAPNDSGYMYFCLAPATFSIARTSDTLNDALFAIADTAAALEESCPNPEGLCPEGMEHGGFEECVSSNQDQDLIDPWAEPYPGK